VAIDTFNTELSSVIRNWLAASTINTRPAPDRVGAGVVTRPSWQPGPTIRSIRFG